MLQIIRRVLLFAYGSSPEVADPHHALSRNVAYTIGGLIVFVTLPFVFCGTVYLIADEFAGIRLLPLRWMGILAAAGVITMAILWVERSLLVLSDALAPHPVPHLLMLALRLGMVCLFSMVIAQKWVLSTYEGPISRQLQDMAHEAIATEKESALTEHSVSEKEGRVQPLQNRITELEGLLKTVPQPVHEIEIRLATAKPYLERLREERRTLRRDPVRNDVQEERLRVLNKRLIPTQSKQVTTLEADRTREWEAYASPLRTELEQKGLELKEAEKAAKTARNTAEKQAEIQGAAAVKALGSAGSDRQAFTRLRETYPEIDEEVRHKTLLLAFLEFMPILLKLLTHNSPISTQARAILQQESEGFRNHSRASVSRERRNGRPPFAAA